MLTTLLITAFYKYGGVLLVRQSLDKKEKLLYTVTVNASFKEFTAEVAHKRDEDCASPTGRMKVFEL